ncbi:TetR/AcrR family transcriptional regulator [Streptomyces sp. NPDC057582]|uniref:TetR/AcrR family transcriptional regulator n=1 Tax=unclassified Streptomyces TaxID=2593676 RepID=UPI0036AB6F59
MSDKTNRNQRSEESRRRILEATLELAAEKGYEGTTIAQVSKRSGLPSGSVYWHFENKDKLFAALLEHSVEAWEERQDWLFRPSELPQDRVRGVVARRAQEATEDASFWRLGLLLTLERRLSGTAAREMFLKIRSTRLATMIDWWEQVLPETVQKSDPSLARRLAQFTMATADGLYVASSAGEDCDTAAVADMLVDSLTHLVEAAGASLRDHPV